LKEGNLNSKPLHFNHRQVQCKKIKNMDGSRHPENYLVVQLTEETNNVDYTKHTKFNVLLDQK